MSKRLRQLTSAPVVKLENQRQPRPARGRKSALSANSSSSAAAQPSEVNAVDDRDENTDEAIMEKRAVNDNFLALCDYPMHLDIPPIEIRENAVKKWDRLPADTRAKIKKVTARLLLMKGGRHDKISGENVKEALGRIDPSYRVHSQAALQAAQGVLRESFGFNLVLTKNPDTAFVVNEIRSKALHRILSSADQHASYRGFCHVVFICLWTSPGRRIDASNLLKSLRKVDPSFPEAVEGVEGSCSSTGKRRAASSCAGGGDLGGMPFSSLIARMVKEGYLTETKDDTDAGNLGKRIYEFGTRFFVEIGVKQLARSYFLAVGDPIDQAYMAEIDREADGFIMANALNADDGGGGEEEFKG